MLVDSGSSASFVSQHLLPRLQGVQNMPKPVKVAVANGSELWCTKEVLGCSWYSQGHVFTTNFRLLPLGSYDVILGMDWLEYHSPMLIDWPKRCMQIEHEGFTVVLQGVTSSATTCGTLNNIQLASMAKQSAVAYEVHICFAADSEEITNISYTELPPEITQVLLDYDDIFQKPTGLPPRRACDHKIPLMQGA